MKSITQIFEQIQRKNPGLGSIPCLVGAIAGQQMTRKKLFYFFGKLVEKSEYEKTEKNQIVDFLWAQITPPKTA